MEKNEEWNQVNHRKEDVQETYDLFLSESESFMEMGVPKKTNTINGRQRDPLWINN